MTDTVQAAHRGSLPDLTICIATYRRPQGLRALLDSLNAMSFDPSLASMSIIVVENCPDDPAEASLGDVSNLSRWPLRYVTEHKRGIVAARNRALDEVDEGADLIAFLDDDETVSEDWLNAMLTTLHETGATAVQGPVLPSFEVAPPDWAAALKLFELGPFADGQPLNFASTNNAMLSAAFVRKHALRFDPRFNTTGGEDEEFFNRLMGHGGTIHAAAGAAVNDLVPAKRLTLNWALRRKFRMGNTLGRIALFHKKDRLFRVIKGIAAFGKGAVLVLTLGLGSRVRMVDGLLEAARGLGVLAAFAGVAFKEYSMSAVSHERGQAVT